MTMICLIGNLIKRENIYLWESTVVPDVPMVGEAVPDVAQSTLLYVLLDRIE